MTHTHDKTLLASMSFADPDKRNSLHDLACQYMAASENAMRGWPNWLLGPYLRLRRCGSRTVILIKWKMQRCMGVGTESAQEIVIKRRNGFCGWFFGRRR